MANGQAANLMDVLELARVRQQSGMVTLEHMQGGRVEDGEIFLQIGQPIYARVGQVIGQAALNRMLEWRNISFSMDTEKSSQDVVTPPVDKGNSPPVPLPQQPPRSSSNLFNKVADKRNASVPTLSDAPGIEWLVPQKRGVERDVLALPLTRRQRYIYFLVDGRRTISDLSRCTGKNIQEIELILNELQRRGLVAV